MKEQADQNQNESGNKKGNHKLWINSSLGSKGSRGSLQYSPQHPDAAQAGHTRQ